MNLNSKIEPQIQVSYLLISGSRSCLLWADCNNIQITFSRHFVNFSKIDEKVTSERVALVYFQFLNQLSSSKMAARQLKMR